MNGYSPKDIKKSGLQPISGVVTEEAISQLAGLSAGGSKNLRVDIKVSNVTVVGSITAKLQHVTTGADTPVDLVGANASVSITADGIVSLTQNIEVSADQPNMPLKKHIQVVLTTTNAGDLVTIENVYLCQEL